MKINEMISRSMIGSINFFQKDHYIVQFISEDFAKIADLLEDNYITRTPNKYYCIFTDNSIFNLIVKEKQYEKINYDSLKKAFSAMKNILTSEKYINIVNKNKILIPENSIGFEKSDWKEIRKIVSDLFFDTNIEITFIEFE